MSGAYSRNKGKRAELELCGLLREYLGVEATRNYKQFAQAQQSLPQRQTHGSQLHS